MLFRDKKILITGGAGFIGSNLAIRLVAEGADVTILDSMLPDYGGNLFNIETIKNKIHVNFSDMRDVPSVSYLVRNKDYIFNIAGQVSHRDSMSDPLMDMEINVRAQLTLLEACRSFNPGVVIVYTSTRQLYGRPHYLPVDENHPINPPDVNGINKLAGERYHTLYANVYSLKSVSLRLTNTYGPRQLIKNARQGFIGWFMNRSITGEKIQLFGTGEQIRDFNHVDDVVEAIIRASLCKDCFGEVYNLSGDKANLKSVAESLMRLSGKGSIEIIPFPEDLKKIDIGDFYGSSEKFRKATGWKPVVALDEGLAKTIRYYQQYKEHYLAAE
jgi:UDP-glucose 4-epimerase